MKKKEINLEDTVEKLRRTELLLLITRKIAGLKNLSEILWTLIEFVSNELDADRGTLFLNDNDTNELYSRVAQGDLTREIRILNNVGIAGAIFQNKTGEIIHDVYEDWQEETNVKLIAISIDDARNTSKLKPMVNAKGWGYEVYQDSNREFATKMGVNPIPHTFLINGEGEIVYEHVTYSEGDEDKLYDKILEITE